MSLTLYIRSPLVTTFLISKLRPATVKNEAIYVLPLKKGYGCKRMMTISLIKPLSSPEEDKSAFFGRMFLDFRKMIDC